MAAGPQCPALIYLPSNLTLRCQLTEEHVVHRWEHRNLDAMLPGEGKARWTKVKALITWEAPCTGHS